MKPTRAHYFYANNWPQRIWLVAWPLAAAGLMILVLGPAPDMSTPLSRDARGYLKLLGLAAAIAFLLGGLIGVFVLGPMYWHRAQLNGVPFAPGDRVEILAGRDRGRIATVAEYNDYRMYVKLEDGRMLDVRKVMRVATSPPGDGGAGNT